MDDKDQTKTDHGKITSEYNKIFISIYVAIGTAAGYVVISPILKFFSESEIYIISLSALLSVLSAAYFMIILGGANEDSEHRAAYIRFRSSLVSGSLVNLYGRSVRRLVALADRVFGDTGKQRESLFPKAFGLQYRAPLWTAQSFDRCLAIAVCYPILMIISAWAVTGHVGAVETILKMKSTAPLSRYTVLAAVWLFTCLYLWKPDRLLLFILPAWILAFAAFNLGGGGGPMVLLVALVAGRHSGSGIVTLFTVIAYSSVVSLPLTQELIVMVLVAVTTAVLAKEAESRGLFKYFVVLSLVASLGLIWQLVHYFSPRVELAVTIPMLYVFGLLAIINAPIDWLGLGFSRALMRRGLELRGLAPLALGIIDVVLSIVLMGLLLLFIIGATTAYNHLVAISGPANFLDLDTTFAGLGARVSGIEPEHIWIYGMLLSSQVPAVINLTIGSISAVRGIPTLNDLVAKNLPPSGGIGFWQRHLVVMVSAIQVFIAIFLSLMVVYYVYFEIYLLLVDLMFFDFMARSIYAG